MWILIAVGQKWLQDGSRRNRQSAADSEAGTEDGRVTETSEAR